MRKSFFVFIIIFALCANLFSTEDNSSDKKIFPGFMEFFWKEKFVSIFDGNQAYYNALKSELFLSLEFPIKFYTVNFWFDDLFISDFNQIAVDKNAGITDGRIIAGDMLYNSFTTGVKNRFKIKKIIDININLEAGIFSPFNDYSTLYLNPSLDLSGNYYTGIYWEIENSYPLEYETFYNTGNLSPSAYVLLAYEFFRFYGPTNFKLTLLTDDYFIPTIYLPPSENKFENKLRTGLNASFYGVIPSLYFVLNTSGYFSSTGITSNAVGFNTGIKYNYKIFTISAEYTGTYDFAIINGSWQNRFDIYFKLGFIY